MTQKKFAMISGGMFFIEFMDILLKAFVKLGGTVENIFEAMKSDSSLIPDIAKFIVSRVKTVKENVLKIISKLSFGERIAKGKYDRVNSDINEKNFPETVPVDYDAGYKLFHFDKNISSDDVIKEMEKQGFRSGTLSELLALGEAKPELQKEFPIVELGSVWQDLGGNRRVAVLHYDDGGRRLSLGWFERGWGCAGYRFLGVRKFC